MGIELNIPLKEMEELEFKYGIHLHVDQCEDGSCDYCEINTWGDRCYCGSTIDEVKEVLKRRYGY